MTGIIIIISVLSILLIGSGIFAIVTKNLLHAVIATGVISLALSVLFFLLHAPDVALTEAAIGVALTTIIFIIAIRNTTEKEDDGKRVKKTDKPEVNKVN